MQPLDIAVQHFFYSTWGSICQKDSPCGWGHCWERQWGLTQSTRQHVHSWFKMYTADARYCLLLDIARYVQSWTQNSTPAEFPLSSLCPFVDQPTDAKLPRSPISTYVQCAALCCSTILFLCDGLVRFHTERVSWEHSLRKALVHTVLRFSDENKCKILPFNISYK